MVVRRQDVWLAEPDPLSVGREQRGKRPVLVVSIDTFNRGTSGLVIAVPLTTRERGVASHVPLMPPEGGLKRKSYAMCEQVKSISKDRLTRFLGRAHEETMRDTEILLRIMLGL